MKDNNVPLNKPMRGDVKKFKVYVRDPATGNVKKVNFGDKNMEIKRDDPDRRRAYRSRHGCDDPGPKTKANYWSCKMWSDKRVSDILKDGVDLKTITFKQFITEQHTGELAKLAAGEKQLGRTVGAQLARMIKLYAKEMWDDGKHRNEFQSFDDFFKHYSKSGWKKDGWMEKFVKYAEGALKQQISEAEIFALVEKGLLDKPTMSAEQLAKHHGVSLEHINRQIKRGTKVEQEHTGNLNLADEIARDHLGEDPNYYTKLAKMENN